MGLMKVLVLDDSQFDLHLIAAQLEGSEFEVHLAQDTEEAILAMQQHRFAVAMIDINLGAEDGSRVGMALKESDPEMATILMTGMVGNFRNFREAFYFDDYIVKGCCGEMLVKILRNAVYKRAMPHEIRLRRLALLHELYPCKELLSGVYRRVVSEPGGDLEKMVGKLRENRFLSWNIYNLFPRREMFTIGCVSTIGCVGRCKFCLHGNEPLVRLLDWQEIIAQVLHSLDSLLAKGVFDPERTLQSRLNFTGMGEPLANMRNVLMSIRKLAAIRELDFQFIITTIGRESDLRTLLDQLNQMKGVMDLSKIKLYLSINFPNAETRGNLMPATKGQDLMKIRDLALEFKEMTGNVATASFILVPGLNDYDPEGVARDWGELDIKLQAFAPSPGFSPIKAASKFQLKQYKRKLEEAGVKNVRIKTVIGGSDNAGCGSNLPDQEMR